VPHRTRTRATRRIRPHAAASAVRPKRRCEGGREPGAALARSGTGRHRTVELDTPPPRAGRASRSSRRCPIRSVCPGARRPRCRRVC
jgi:hypothetical protein